MGLREQTENKVPGSRRDDGGVSGMAAKVIVTCGSGIVTSQMVAGKISKLLEQRGVDADVQAIDIKSLSHYIGSADAFVPVVNTTERYDVPTFNGVAFLTGMGEEEELERLVETLTS